MKELISIKTKIREVQSIKRDLMIRKLQMNVNYRESAPSKEGGEEALSRTRDIKKLSIEILAFDEVIELLNKEIFEPV